MPHLSIRMLGPLQVALDGEPVTDFATDKVRALLAFLAVEADRPHRRESLAGLLWPDQPEQAARASLRRALADLRQAIRDSEAKPSLLLVSRQMIQINPSGDVWVDVNEFAGAQVDGASIERLEDAVDLYRGDFLEGLSVFDGVAFEEWALLQREQLKRQRIANLDRLADHHESLGDNERALAHAWSRVEADRWNESAHRQLMRLLARSGRRSAAIGQYEKMRSSLGEDLGIEPEEASTTLFEQIRAGGLEPLPGQPGVGAPDREARLVGNCPYRGLAAFKEADAPFFYGREPFVDRLVEAVRERPVVAVIVGSSGSGKSSAVFAGLLPRLRADSDWQIIHFRPGSEPFHAMAGALLQGLEPQLNETERLIESSRLAEALREGEVRLHHIVENVLARDERAERLLLFVDQAEELYTLCPDPELQRRFLDELLEAVEAVRGQRSSPLVLLVTLRADFMGQALAHRSLADALQEGSLMLGPMNRDELRLAIEQPAETQGAAFEAGLVDRLLDDVGEEPGNLPLLEFALTLLWEQRSNGWLTHSGYEGIGRVHGALARYADEVFAGLSPEEQAKARHVFEQLVRPGEGTEDTRRVATRAELGDENWDLATYLADKRLVVTGQDAGGQDTVEIVHEALIQRWERLQTWMETDRSFRIWQERLRAGLRAWTSSDNDDGALLRGAPLVEAESWVAERESELSDDEKRFVRAGAGLRQNQQAERERRRRRTILTLGTGLVVALVLALFAFDARSDARYEAAVNRSLLLASAAEDAFISGDTNLALALALESVDMDQPPNEARRTLSTVALGVGTRAILEGHSDAVRGAALSPDARLALSGSCGGFDETGVCTQGELILWDLEARAEAARFTGHSGWINDVAFSPDGATALSASGDGTLVLWDVETGEETRRLEGHTAGVTTVAFSPDGTTALSGSDDSTVIVWNVVTGEVTYQMEGHDGGVTRVAFGPDGTTVLSTSKDRTVILWDLSNGEAISRFEGHGKTVTDAVFHPDGKKILSLSEDASLRVWDLDTGEEIASGAFTAQPTSLAITPDGDTALVSVKTDLSRWDVTGWREKGTLVGSQVLDDAGDIHSVSISNDGRLALSAGSDGTVRLWNLRPLATRRFPTDGAGIVALAVNSDGSRLLTGSESGETILWDVDTGQVLRRFGGEGYGVSPGCLAFGPGTGDGQGEESALVCASDIFEESERTSLVLWDLATGEETRRFEGHATYVRALAFSPDGRHALAGSQGFPEFTVGDLILWDLETGEEVRRFEHSLDITDIVISADGSQAVTSSATDGVVILWDVATGREIRRFEGHTSAVLNVAFGPGEDTVLTGSWGNALILWELETAKIIRRFETHSRVWGLDISSDGRFAVSGLDDGTVVLWDLQTGEELSRLTVHTGSVLDVVIHPDGQSVFSAGRGGRLVQWQIWDPSSAELLEWIETNRYVRELTCEEGKSYGVSLPDC